MTKEMEALALMRRTYKTDFHFCQCCQKALACDVHEMARGVHRSKAVSEPCTWLALCRMCHNDMGDYSQWPLTRQLALKLIVDGDRLDLKKFNRIRGRADTAITLSDVAKHLTLKE